LVASWRACGVCVRNVNPLQRERNWRFSQHYKNGVEATVRIF
jgi:hypothetical protein